MVTKFKRPVGAWPEKLEWITTDGKKKPKGTLSSVGSFDPSDLAFLQFTSGKLSTKGHYSNGRTPN